MNITNKTLSIVIPTYKPDKYFVEVLNRLNQQTMKPNKIIIMNTNERYLQESDFAGFSNVHIYHIEQSEFDHAATRNKAILLADSDFVLFMTQDAYPQNERLIEELIKPFEDDLVTVAYARQIPKEDCNIAEKYTRSFNYPDYDIVKRKEDIDKLGIKTYFCSDVCAAYRVDRYKELGGFVKRTIFNEDGIYAAKVIHAGYKVYYASKALVVHSHNYNAMQYFHRNFDLGVSHAEFAHVFDKVRSEDEGIKLVKNSIKHLLEKKKWYLIPDLIIKSGSKYIGFQLGKKYKHLPKWFLLKCTMSKHYWGE